MGVRPCPDHFFGSKFRFFKFVWNLVWDAKNGPKTARKAFFKYFCSCGARLGYPGLQPGYPAEHHNRDFIVVCSFLGVGRARKGVFASV